MASIYRHFEDNHPFLAMILGGLIGLSVGAAVLFALLAGGALLFDFRPPEGKGCVVVEALWTYFGVPVCVVIGLFWPHTIGRRFREEKEPVAARLCPCCGNRTLVERAAFEVCPVCHWEDDGQGDADADEVRGGPNRDLSLAQARRNYREFGASHRDRLPLVRPPLPGE